MWIFLKPAAANLRRHKRRNLLTGFMIFTGALIMVLAFSYAQSIERALSAGAVESVTGHIQVRPVSEREIEVLYMDTDDFLTATGRVKELLLARAETAAVAPRLTFWGMLAGDEKETGVAVAAVDPAADPLVFPRLKVTAGNYLSRPDGLLLGESTARSLEVTPGDELLLLAQTPDGYLNAVNLVVEGLVKAEGVSMFIDYIVYMDLTTAQDLLYLPEDRSSFLAVALAEGIREKPAAAGYRELLAAEGWELRVDVWHEVAGIFHGIIMSAKFLPGIALAVILLVIAAGIANTVLVTVLERTREIGTLMALGTKRGEIVRLFLLENAVLSGIAAGLGVLIGGAAVFWLGKVGVAAPAEAMEFVFGGPRLYFVFSLPVLILCFAGTVIFSVAVAALPARRAGSLAPVAALRVG